MEPPSPQQAVRGILVAIQYLVVSQLLLVVVGVVPVLALLVVLAAEEGVVAVGALELQGKEMQVALEVVAMRVVAVEALQRLAVVEEVLLVGMVALEQQAAYLALVLLMLAGAVAQVLVETVQAVLAVALHGQIMPLQILEEAGDVHGTLQTQVLMEVPVLSSSVTQALSGVQAVL